MVIKTLTRKNNVGQLIKYVLADYKIEPDKKNEVRGRYYIPNVRLTEQDRDHLNAEVSDGKVLRSLKDFLKFGTVKEFIQAQLLKFPNAKYKNDEQRKLKPMVITQNLRGRSIENWIQEFDSNNELRLNPRVGSVQAYHHVLSFNSCETPNIDEKMLADITRKFIALNGDKSIYLSVLHQDKNHIHIHLIQSGVQYKTGISNRMSKAGYQGMKKALQEYQMSRYPQLKHSLPDHGRDQRNKDTAEKPYIKTDRTTKLNSLLAVLESSHKESKSLEDFFGRINAAGHEVYFRNGRPQGIKYNQIKFRFSRLGYTEKLSELQQLKDRTEKELQELQSIRSGGRKARTIEMEGSQHKQATPTVQDRLASLNGDARRRLEQEMLDKNRAFEKTHNEGRTLNDNSNERVGRDTAMPAAKERLQDLADLRNKHREEQERDYEEETQSVPDRVEDDTGKGLTEDKHEQEPEDEEDNTALNEENEEDYTP